MDETVEIKATKNGRQMLVWKRAQWSKETKKYVESLLASGQKVKVDGKAYSRTKARG